MTRQGLAAKALQGASWYFLEKFVRLLGAFLVGAWVARYLGPESYGTLAFATAMVATLGFFASWGVESLVVRDLVLHPDRTRRIVTTYFVVRLAGASCIPAILLTYLAVTHPDDHELMMLSAILASGALLTAFDAADCWLQAINQSRATSLIRLGGFLGGALLKCVAILAGASVLFIAIATVVESAIIAGAYWWRLSRNQLTPSFAAWDRQELRTLFVDGKLMILSAMTVVVYSKLDILAIGSLMSKQELGTYAIAASMYGAWNVLGVSLAQAWAPHIAAAQRVGRRGYLAALRFFLGVMMAVSVLGSAVLAFIAPWVFSLLFGPAYREGADVFSWLIWASVPVFLGVASSQIIINERLYWISLVRTALGMAVGLAFIVPAASYGVLGVAVLVIVSSSVATSAILISPSARSTLKSAFFSYRDSA